ncbi:MAG: metallophosphoesterase [Eubacteriales bacterium]|nr:metallophosphoesterase [Eubacteriales bacterium]
MKRVIAVSDSHGMTGELRSAVLAAYQRGQVDAAVFLGDGYGDWKTVSTELKALHPETKLHAVRGNNDWGDDAPMAQLFKMDGVTFYACHGHQHHVKYGLDRLMYAAREAEAQVALFGHTHQSCLTAEYGCWFINPGSVSGFEAPLYAEIIIEEDGTVRPRIVRKVS